MSSRGTSSRSKRRAVAFRKGALCPSSDFLLQYCQQESCVAPERRAQLSRHLAACDFCAAEFQLLCAYPPQTQTLTTYPPTQMPMHLYALARAILNRASKPVPHTVEAK